MTVRIKVTGFIEIEDDEYDPGPYGPLTQEAFEQYVEPLRMDDLRLEVDLGS